MNLHSPLHSRYSCRCAHLLCASVVFFLFMYPHTARGVTPQQFNLTVLSSDLDDSQIPVINGDNVIWIGKHGNEYGVYGYNISTNVRSELTSNAPGVGYIAVDGNYVAWDGIGVSLYDLTVGSAVQINSDPRSWTPKISGKNVVWLEGREQDS